MSEFEDEQAFGRRLSAVRGWMQLQRPDFADFMDVHESTVRRWEKGDIGKKRANAEARRQFAIEMMRKTGAPADVLGLSEPEPSGVDRLSQVVAQMSKAQNRLSGELAEAQKAQQEMLTRIERLEHGEEEVH